jgi:hypothetical protein
MLLDDAPMQLHPRIQELIDCLEEHRRGLHDAIADVPPELRDRKPTSGGWSVAEVVEHLTMIETRVAKMMTREATAARASGVGPDTNTSSVVASFVNPGGVVDRGSRIESPKLVIPTGTIDAVAGTQALDRAHDALVSALQNANGVSLEDRIQAHPVLGPMNMYHWVVMLALHDDRHAAQIREIGQSLAGE